MAKSTSRPPKKPIPISPETPFEELPPDTSAAEPETEVVQPPKTEPKLPRAGPPPKTPTFLETMNKVGKSDWGARANIYLYRVEPMIDRTRSGENKFVNVYAEPISEDRVMADYGSGRYKLILNFRKPGAETGDLIDSMYMDILNMKYPPKIPLGEWVDDPRNKKWAWAKEATGTGAAPQQPTPTGVEAFVDVLRATGDIRREIREEMQDNAPSPAAIAAVDPWSAAEKILNMRSENPMVAILQQQMKDAATAAENERTRAFTAAESARDREFKLQEKLLEARTTTTAAEKPKTLMEQLTDFKALKDLFTNGSVGETVRAGRTTALDVARDLGSKFFESDLAMGVGQYLASLATRNVSGNGNPAQMNPGAPQNGVQRPANDFEAFIQNVLNPALLRHYIQGFTGGEFAGWLYDGYPDRVVQLQNFTHPMMPGLKGANAIIQAYKRTESMWPTLSSARPNGEAGFTEFVMEFCAWKPESDEPIEVKPVEHDGEQEEEGPERI